MSLRDYFAAKAMQAAATNPKGADGMIKDDADSKLLMECAVKISGLQRRIDTWADFEESMVK